MALLARLQREREMALVLITHDLALVAEYAQRVAVMYAGQVLETAPVPALFDAPRHPYTAALLAAMPERSEGATQLANIPGVVPGLYDRPAGCLFAPRCDYATAHSQAVRPGLREWQGGWVRCHHPQGDPAREANIALHGRLAEVVSA